MTRSCAELEDGPLPADTSVWLPASGDQPSLCDCAAAVDGYAVLQGSLDFAEAIHSVYRSTPGVLSLLTLQGLRILLFAEWRAYVWAEGWEPNETSPYVRKIIAQIRLRLGAHSPCGYR